MKERVSGRRSSHRYINPAAVFKTIRINVIIYRFSLLVKATRKNKKNLNTLVTNPRGWTSTKEGVTEM